VSSVSSLVILAKIGNTNK
ncbi:hypothetical protein FWK35_00036774, partial [Aphis craccivora]